MPLPQDDTLPQGNTASTSHTEAPVDSESAAEMLDKFKQLGVEAAAEEEEEEGEEGEEAGDGAGGSVSGQAGRGGEGGQGEKKKKKKKKGKASKAVAELK